MTTAIILWLYIGGAMVTSLLQAALTQAERR